MKGFAVTVLVVSYNKPTTITYLESEGGFNLQIKNVSSSLKKYKL